MQGTLMIRWTTPKPGHEMDSMELADHSDQHFSALERSGMIAGHEWIANFTGSDGGMLVVRGEPAKLAEVSMSPEFGEIHLRGVLHLEHWHWDLGLSGDTVDEVYPHYRELVSA